MSNAKAVRLFLSTSATILSSAIASNLEFATTTASALTSNSSNGWSNLPAAAKAGIFVGIVLAVLIFLNGIRHLLCGPHDSTGNTTRSDRAAYPGRVEYCGVGGDGERRVYAAITPLQRATLREIQDHEYSPYMIAKPELEKEEKRRLQTTGTAKQRANDDDGGRMSVWATHEVPLRPSRQPPAVSSHRFR